jgi:hypothetical protein
MSERRHTRIALGGLLALAGACKDEADEGTPAVEDTPEGTPAVEGAPAVEDAGPKGAEPAAPAEPPPSGHAVARVGSLLFLSSTGDVGFELPPLPTAAGMTVNVVGEQDGRLVVETLVTEPAEHHCAATLDDLLPVLTEELDHAFADGTKLRLARGVPVPAGSAEIVVRGTAVHVPVPAERLGRFYPPGQPFASEGGDGKLYPLDGHALTYDGRTIDETHLHHDAGNVVRFGATERTSDALVTVRNPCLEASVLVSTERLHAAPPYGGLYAMKPSEGTGHFLASPYGSAFAAGGDDEDVWGGLTGTEIGEAYGVGGLGLVGAGAGVETRHEVKAGTAIVWADGGPAGQVTADHRFEGKPRDQGGRSCFDAPLVAGQATTLTLCFAPGDVGEVTVPSSGLGTGTIGTGTIGTGGVGGLGTSSGFGGRGKKVPKVRQSKAEVKGSLDKDIIRRIVRAHINEVRHCYNQGLTRDSSLSGKVTIQFTVNPVGSVPVALVSESTIKDSDVSNCIAKAVKRWKFPKPYGGGNVVVTYPFVLEPG